MEEGFEEATRKINEGTNEEEEETSQCVCNKTEGKNKESIDQFDKQGSDNV